MRYSQFLATVGVCMLASCASYKMHVTDDKVPEPLGLDVEHRVFLIGDAGDTTLRQKRNLTLMKERIRSSDVPSTVVFLGDNIYPAGMPPTDDPNRQKYETILVRQMEVAKETGAEVYFILGNHDWKKGKKGGLKAARRAEDFVKDYDHKDVEQIPEDGCPGPEDIELTDNVVMILFDSQWWLQDWSTEKDINDDCDVTSRLDFLKLFEEMLKDHQDKRVIVAMHHPFFSSGPHGGYFTPKDHLFPLTNISPGLWIPLPVIGSIYPIYRSNFGHVQDHAHQKYYALSNGIRNAAKAYDNVIFVSGHEHALEYHRDDRNHHHIVSGSGAKVSPIGKPRTQLFGHGEGGFVQLDVMRNGAVDLAIWEPAANGNASGPVFTCNLTEEKELLVVEPDLPETSELADSTTAFLSDEYDKSGLYRFLFGERYRALYSQPVTVRNIRLEREKGGLVPVKRGGGFQTNSLRLENPNEKEYVLRSLNKDATRLLPEIFQSTFALDILQDQFTASNPYGAFVIPEMASAAGIYHTNPEAVYLPKQQALGKYAEDYGEDFYLFEERPNGDWSEHESFGGSEEIMSYSDMIEETYEDDDEVVDQRFVLRSRLFDMFIGDWDRHDDQWRWAAFDNPDGRGKIYRPIPRDRDQAFSTYDGVVVKLANWYTPTLRKMTVFEDDIKRINWFNFNARYFDRDFMNGLTYEDWQELAADLQVRLTDEVIDASLAEWPDEIYAVQGDYIARTLKARRDNLPDFAARYYAFLAKEVTVTGTEDADYFLITRGNGITRVQVFDSNKEGEVNDQYYDRVFVDGETREVRIYGGEGHDHFRIEGEGSSRIKVRIIGGGAKDQYITDGSVPSKVQVYDRQDHVPGVRYTRLHDKEDNAHDRLGFKYNYALPLLVVGGNPDDGFLLGGGVQFVRHGFLKKPYASKHSISGFYAFGSGSYGFNYQGEFRLPMSKTSISLIGIFEGPSYVQNYFGLGNDSEEINDDIDFYRVRKRNYAFIPGLLFGNDRGSQLGIHVGVRSQSVEQTSGRFITDPDNGLPGSIFDERNDGIARIEYHYELIDNPIIPRRGIRFKVTGGLDYAFDQKMTHRFFEGALTMYYQLKTLGKPTIATRVGAAFHGGHYQFYQGALLGAHDNFRGMRKQLFVVDKMFYHNTDIRLRLTSFRNYYLPAAVGIVINFDHGRVWLDGEESDTWHYAYGGGIWVSPFQTLMLSFNYNVSDVDERLSLGMGFFF